MTNNKNFMGKLCFKIGMIFYIGNFYLFSPRHISQLLPMAVQITYKFIHELSPPDTPSPFRLGHSLRGGLVM